MVQKTTVLKEQRENGDLIRQVVQKTEWGNSALTKQSVINAFNFPFTLNPGSGCFYTCAYCFLQQPFFDRHTQASWSEEMNYKEGFVDKLIRDLEKLKDLPQYMKRVQLGVSTEVYHPKAIQYYKPRKILEAFQQYGSDWMIHLLTKSNKVLDDIDLISEMRNQIQMEVSFATLDGDAYRKFEKGTPHPRTRLQIVEDFCNHEVFVRGMCMPVLRKIKLAKEGSSIFPVYRNKDNSKEVAMHKVGRANSGKGIRYHYVENGKKVQVEDINKWDLVILEDYSKAQEMKSFLSNLGAKAFKSKDLNYYYVEELLNAQDENRKPVEQKGRFEDPTVEILDNSGEAVLDDEGNPIEVEVEDYSSKKKDWINGKPPKITRNKMNYGYSTISDIDWIDCV